MKENHKGEYLYLAFLRFSLNCGALPTNIGSIDWTMMDLNAAY